VQARDAEAFGPREIQSRVGFAPSPRGPGPRIEEHARDREVEPDTRPLGFVVDASEQRCDPIDNADLEVSPSAVDRDVERRIGAPHLVGDVVGGIGKPIRVEYEMREGVTLARGEHLVTAFPDRADVKQRRRRRIRRHGPLGGMKHPTSNFGIPDAR